MKAITNPLALAQQAAQEYQACYGDECISVILYGSAAGGDFDPKNSDINLLILLKSVSVRALEKSAAIQYRWEKKRFALPLFMDENYIARSLDSFPIEFLSMKECYTVLAGSDPLAALRIDHDNLRLQIERELKGKQLHLLRAWLHARRTPKHIERLYAASMRDFAAVFQALLQLAGDTAPRERQALFSAVEKAYGLAGEPFTSAHTAYRSGDRKRMAAAFEGYAQGIWKLAEIIDKE